MITEKRTYIIPLRKVWMKVPQYKRTARAMRAIREYIKKHTKETEIKIGKHLNLKMWSRGPKKPPHKIHVNAIPVEVMEKKKMVGRFIKVELFGAPEENAEEKKETIEKVVEKPKEAEEKEEAPSKEKKKSKEKKEKKK